MALNWIAWRTSSEEPPATLPLPFSPIASAEARVFDRPISGTAFVVHPQAAITCAHVVTEFGYGQTHRAWKVQLDFGSRRVWAAAVAAPVEYLKDNAPEADVALVLLRQPVCSPAEALSLGPLGPVGASLPATLHGHAGPVDVLATRAPQWVQYPAPNLPGHSGGPVVPPGPLAGARVLAVHRRHDGQAGLGQGLPLTNEELDAAKAALSRLEKES